MSANEKTIPPPDLELRIQTDSEFGQTRLVYTLHSPAGKAPFAHRKIVGPTFSGSPEALHLRLLHQIEGLGGRLDVDGSPVYRQEVQNKLDGVGRELWNQLFNEEMRQAYRRFRSVDTLLIISDEPWIPWEMVKPYDDQGEVLDDEFFAERFELTRWLAGDRSVPNEIAVRALACVVQGDNLPSAGVEWDLITGLSRSATVRDASPASVSVETLTALLGAGGIGLFHFTGHGKLDPALSNEAGLLLADGSSFRPTDLHGPVQTQVAKDRPLVFLNACRSAGQGWSWTGLGGWANRWVRICGCGAFVGSQWNVRDSVAFAFAKAFYEALIRGETLGKSAKAAREEARKAARGTPGWLAYAVYGHPSARVVFGQDVSAATVEVIQEPPRLKRPPIFDIFTREIDDPIVAEKARALEKKEVPMRSDNIKIKKKFSDLDRDRFIEESFNFIASYFENSLAALQRQDISIKTNFRQVDQNLFTAAVYVDGNKESSCRVWMRGTLGDIGYADSDSSHDNSYNEALSVTDDGYSLLLHPVFGLAFFGSSDREKLTQQEVAEYLWARFIKRLQE